MDRKMCRLSKCRGQLSKTKNGISDKVGAMRTQDQQLTDPPAVLIIDDDGPTQELYAGVLGRHFRVILCSTQQDALDTLSREDLQLVVLEPSVAGNDGWSFLEHIVRTYSVPVIVCSASDDRRMGMNAGANTYLIKPVLPLTLLEVSKNVLTRPHSYQGTDDANPE